MLSDFVTVHRDAIDKLIAEATATIEYEAAHHFADQHGKVIVMTVADLLRRDWLDARMLRGEESAFRRGYLNGYSQAMDDLRSGCKPSRWQSVARWFDDVLMAWRYSKPRRMAIPPSFAGSGVAVAAPPGATLPGVAAHKAETYPQPYPQPRKD